jgi:phenylpyruvate tautomerase PptA (4-oxalocrotonate tautomerase family)
MPLIQVTMVQEAVGTPKDRIRVAIYEITADEWGIGGVPFSTARGTDPNAPADSTR